MKKTVLGLFLSVCLTANAQIKNAGCFLRMVEPIKSDTLAYSNDSVQISFTFNNMNYFVEVEVKNKTNEIISVDWDKFLIINGTTSKPIIFDDTVIALKDVPKGKSQIAPMTKIYKSIMAKDNIEYPIALYSKKYVKIRPCQIGFIVPIEYANGHKDYKCTIEAYIPKK